VRRTGRLTRRTPLNPVSRRRRQRLNTGDEPTPTEARTAIYARSSGHCEIGWHPITFADMEASHRKAKAQGGTWHVHNLLAACKWDHLYGPVAPHHQPERARERGLVVRRGEDPLLVPVLLGSGRWVRLTADGGYQPLREGTG
jgi:hypothetical protein